MSEAVVTVTVAGAVTATISSDTSERRTGDHPEQEVQQGSRQPSSLPGSSSSPWPYSSSSPTFPPTSASSPPSTASSFLSPFFSSTVSSATAPSTRISTSTAMASRPSLRPDGEKSAKAEMGGGKLPPASASRREELALLDRALPMETNATIENLQVVSETEGSVLLMWDSVNTTRNSEVTVFYSKYGEKDLLLLHVNSSKNQVTINGLLPGWQYIACVCPKGMPPQEDQCITFSTDRAEEEGDSQESLLMVVSGAACVAVLPLIFFLLYKVCKLQCKPDSLWEDDLAKETYIQFETLSPRSQSVGELWTRRPRAESEELPLCSRSSVESPDY